MSRRLATLPKGEAAVLELRLQDRLDRLERSGLRSSPCPHQRTPGYVIRSRRWTDTLYLDRHLLEQGSANGNLLTLLPICDDHFVNSVFQ